MADNGNAGVVDTLSIQIDASAKEAMSSLSKLETRLRSLSVSVKNLSGSAQSLNILTNSMQRLSNVNVGGLSKAIDQLERISKLNLKDQRIKLDVKLTGVDEAERKALAVQEAFKKIDTEKLAKDFNNVFGLKGIDANRVKNMYDEALKDLVNGGNGNKAFIDWESQLNVNGLRMAKSSIEGILHITEEKWKNAEIVLQIRYVLGVWE